MRILVTGANGYCGARVYFDLVQHFGKESITGTYHTKSLGPLVKLDITNRDQTLGVITEYTPDVVVHVASNPFIKWCEANPEQAKQINEEGAGNVVDAANVVGSKFIYVSTDRVLKPVNVYSKTKLAAEELAKGCTAGFTIVRPAGIVIGYSPNTENDRAFNRLLLNLQGKSPAIYDSVWKSHVTWMGHLSEVIIAAIERPLDDQTIAVASPGEKSRFEVARDVLSNFNIPVTPKDDDDGSPVIDLDLAKLGQFNLPEYSYDQIIAKTVDEIKNGSKFVIA